jgi:hypothetical protein
MARLGLVFCVSAALLLTGCVAEFSQKRAPRRSTVPGVGYIDTGGGDVRYSAEGWGLVLWLRHAAAMRKVRGLCRAKDLKVRIVDEFTHNDTDMIYTGEELDVNIKNGLDQYHVAPFHHIVFECQLSTGTAKP